MTVRRKTTPVVGIFFVVDGKDLFVDCTPVNQAFGYGDFLIHEGGHLTYWDQLPEARAVPSYQYDEIPRGRVVYYQRTRQFTLFADRCILKDRCPVDRVEDRMDLRLNTKVEADPHYRCPGCMGEGRTAMPLDSSELRNVK